MDEFSQGKASPTTQQEVRSESRKERQPWRDMNQAGRPTSCHVKNRKMTFVHRVTDDFFHRPQLKAAIHTFPSSLQYQSLCPPLPLSVPGHLEGTCDPLLLFHVHDDIALVMWF